MSFHSLNSQPRERGQLKAPGRLQIAPLKNGNTVSSAFPHSRIPEQPRNMDCKVIPIRELLQQCLDSDDPDAWWEFHQRLQKPLAAVIIRTLGSKLAHASTVKDLEHNTWVKLFDKNRKALQRIKGEYDNSIFAYVQRTAYRVTLDYLREVQRFQVLSTDDECFVEPSNMKWVDIFGHLDKEELERFLLAVCHQPNFERNCTMFWLHYEQGYTFKEITKLKFGLNESGVEAAVYRLRDDIKKMMGK